ncbi:hypothetical protein RJ640_013150 [Escallonia rubra]|uniref:Leucine-rich repeat-containing N-terminal plant-type domain-containing protein n=1 Tax=Escallonia rubra TaxID=112253 RepID=A0AA88UE09_9ASTE|nr:hypothetical protein RJ640_013150 [Escallonia rubra]
MWKIFFLVRFLAQSQLFRTCYHRVLQQIVQGHRAYINVFEFYPTAKFVFIELAVESGEGVRRLGQCDELEDQSGSSAFMQCFPFNKCRVHSRGLEGRCNLFNFYSGYLIYHQDDEDNTDQGQRRYLNFFKLALLFLLISLLPTSQLKPGAMKKTAVVMMFVILLLLHYCLDACLAASVTNFTDESALLAFKASIISDPNIILAKNWSQGISFCSWIGVSCSSDKRVTALNLPNMGLTGTIPKEVGNLTYLTSFNISNNTFNGTLPRELGLLQRLQSINLRANKLSGSIPVEIGNLTKLEELDFGVNDFTGEIPASIFNISSLQRLSLRNNSLVGTLPADMCNNLYILGFSLFHSIGWVVKYQAV